jgi:hypothetical protein
MSGHGATRGCNPHPPFLRDSCHICSTPRVCRIHRNDMTVTWALYSYEHKWRLGHWCGVYHGVFTKAGNWCFTYCECAIIIIYNTKLPSFKGLAINWGLQFGIGHPILTGSTISQGALVQFFNTLYSLILELSHSIEVYSFNPWFYSVNP